MNIMYISNVAKTLACAALASLSISPLAAQSYHPSTDYGTRDVRASASITIPLGGNRDNAKSQPRVEFSFQQSRIEQDRLKLDFNRYSLQNAPITNANTNRVGFTLNKNPKMLVNGRAFKIVERKDLTTGETILVVVGALAVTTLISAVVIADSIEDIFEPD